MWRPEKRDWAEMLLVELKKVPDPELLKGNIPEALLLFAEAGADAMLKALKVHNGWYGLAGEWDTKIPERMGAKGKAGWLVFIEEESDGTGEI